MPLGALNVFPDNPEAHFHMGTIRGRLGDPASAILHLETAVSINPHDFVAVGNLGAAHFQNGNIDLAKKCFVHALSLNPEYSFARNNLLRIQNLQDNDRTADDEN